MIEAVILYILNKYDATIYRVGRIIDELFFAYLKSSTGTINPALKRLEKAGCVTCCEKMTDGGMLSKIYSITKEGRKYLADYLITFESQNPYHIINEAKIALFCSDILDESELAEFKNNLKNILELHKLKLERAKENEYINLSEIQKNTVDITIDELTNLIALI